MTQIEQIQQAIRAIPDFPKKGIVFRDISSLLAKPEIFQSVIDLLAQRYDGKIQAIAGIDSRGFLFGAPLAYKLGLPFVMVRKAGKLPGNVITESYTLEYGENKLQIQADALPKNSNVLLVDDLLATGGSAQAAISLLESIGANVVSSAFIIELLGLDGRELLEEKGGEVYSIVTF